MKPPNELPLVLTPDQLSQVAELDRDIEEQLKTHAELVFNLDEERVFPEEVWRELIKRAKDAGWDAEIVGAVVTIRRPKEPAPNQKSKNAPNAPAQDKKAPAQDKKPKD